jgi:hypothetical protein
VDDYDDAEMQIAARALAAAKRAAENGADGAAAAALLDAQVRFDRATQTLQRAMNQAIADRRRREQ